MEKTAVCWIVGGIDSINYSLNDESSENVGIICIRTDNSEYAGNGAHVGVVVVEGVQQRNLITAYILGNCRFMFGCPTFLGNKLISVGDFLFLRNGKLCS